MCRRSRRRKAWCYGHRRSQHVALRRAAHSDARRTVAQRTAGRCRGAVHPAAAPPRYGGDGARRPQACVAGEAARRYGRRNRTVADRRRGRAMRVVRHLAFPANRDAPIAATLSISDAAGLPISADFDFRQTGPQTWDIDVDTDEGSVRLSSDGPNCLSTADSAWRPSTPSTLSSTGVSSNSPKRVNPTSISPRSSLSPMPLC